VHGIKGKEAVSTSPLLRLSFRSLTYFHKRCASTVEEAAHALDKLEERVHAIKGKEAALVELRAQLLAQEKEVTAKEERFFEIVKQESGILF
jgi:3-dehydroquinate dehydratase